MRPKSPKEKLSRYLWSFGLDYNATVLAAKMYTNSDEQNMYIRFLLLFLSKQYHVACVFASNLRLCK